MPSTRPTIDRPARRRTASLRRALLLSSCAAAVAPMSGGVALAGRGVKLDGVAAGAASIARAGPLTTVTASDGSILRFNSFDVARGQSVRFVQPSAQARALARIGGSAPSRIDGNLSANGILYLVNPAGVIFGGGAVVNVGHLYAAAGSISDADFRAGVDRFTHVSGAVSNLGSIRGDSVFLIGNNVSNGGTITAEGGTIAMIAGDEALLTNLDDHLVVRVRADALAPAATATTPQLEQSGQLSAPRGRVLLAAGDHYSLAVGGRVRAATVAVQGGVGSTATLHGTIDVSNAQAKGGDAHVSATHVALSGATIDAGGATAGGGVSIEAAAQRRRRGSTSTCIARSRRARPPSTASAARSG